MLSRLKSKLEGAFMYPAKAFVAAGFTPNALTMFGLIFALVGFVIYAQGHALLGGLTLLVCGFFDAIDGAVARMSGKETPFGGLLDSVVDRYSDFLILVGILLGRLAGLGWVLAAILGSFMVSYVRARAEAAGSGGMAVGIAERPERILILAFFSLIGKTHYGVAIVAILSNITAIQRIIVAKSRLT